MSSITSTLLGFDALQVVIMSFSQVVVSAFWFHIIVHHFESYYLAADKGVRRVEHVIHRYPQIMVWVINFLCCVLRSGFVMGLLAYFNAENLVDYQHVALIAAFMSLVTSHRHFAYQRPVQIFVSMWGFELIASMVAAVVCFYLRANKIEMNLLL